MEGLMAPPASLLVSSVVDDDELAPRTQAALQRKCVQLGRSNAVCVADEDERGAGERLFVRARMEAQLPVVSPAHWQRGRRVWE